MNKETREPKIKNFQFFDHAFFPPEHTLLLSDPNVKQKIKLFLKNKKPITMVRMGKQFFVKNWGQGKNSWFQAWQK
jgi:hypothetical protein